MRERNAELLLAGVILARSTSYLFTKIGLGSMSPFNLLGVRFCVAFLLLALLFYKRLTRVRLADLLRGLALGGLYAAVMTAETFALKHTSASNTSFLENTAIVIVPLLGACLQRALPDRRTALSAVITLAGVACLTLAGRLRAGLGESLGLLAAFLYACAILLTDKLSREGDPLTLGILQVGFMGALMLGASFLFETPRLPQNATEWWVVAALAVVCSCFGFTLQPVAQKYTSAARAGQFCALNPLAVAIYGYFLMGERLGVSGVVGAALILLGILLQTSRASAGHKRS